MISLHSMISKYVEVPPSSPGIFLVLSVLDTMVNLKKDITKSRFNEREINMSIMDLCKDLPIKLNGKSGIVGLSFDIMNICDFISVYNCIQTTSTDDEKSMNSLVESTVRTPTDSKRVVDIVLNTLRSKWSDYMNKFIKGQKDLVAKKQSLLTMASIAATPSEAAADEDSSKQSTSTATIKPESEPVVLAKDHVADAVCNYRSWLLLDRMGDAGALKRMDMLTNPKATFQDFHQTIYMEQYVLETEECLLRRILAQLDVNLLSELTVEQKPNSYIRTGTRYLLSDYRYKPPVLAKPPIVEVVVPVKLTTVVHPPTESKQRKEKILSIVGGKSGESADKHVTSSSHGGGGGGGLFSKSLINGTQFTAQTLADKARKVTKYRENYPVDIVQLQKRYEDVYEACSVYRSVSTAGHTPKIGKKAKAALPLVLDSGGVPAVKKRRSHAIPPCAIQLNDNVQVNPSGNEYNLYAASTSLQSNATVPGVSIIRSASNASESNKALKRSASGSNIASNSFSLSANSAASAVLSTPYLPPHPGHILLPDLAIRTTEIPWNMIAREFITLDHTEELGDYGSMKRSVSNVEVLDESHLPDVNGSERKSRLKRKHSDSNEVDDAADLLTSRNAYLGQEMKKHVSIVLAPKFEPIPPTMFKKYPTKACVASVAVPSEEYSIGSVDITSEDSDEDISEETMLRKHDAVLANMRDKWVQFASLRKASVDTSMVAAAGVSTPRGTTVNKFSRKRTISNVSNTNEYVSNSPTNKMQHGRCSSSNSIANLSNNSSPSENCSPDNAPKKARGRPVKAALKASLK